MNITRFGKAAILAVFMHMSAAHASVIKYEDITAADLSALGTITQSIDFDAYPHGRGDSTTVPSGAKVGGDFSMATSSVARITAPLFTTRPLLTGGAGKDAILDIAGQHELFGFNAANYNAQAAATFILTTNLASYEFELDLMAARDGLRYFGFKSDAGEYFTGFAYGGGATVGVTDLLLGTTAAGAGSGPTDIPEPGILALFCAGISASVFARRKAV